MSNTMVTLRRITHDDLAAITRLTAEAWYEDPAFCAAGGELPELLATHEACTFLADMTWGLIAEASGSTLGIIACASGEPEGRESAWWRARGADALARARAIDAQACAAGLAPVDDEARAVAEMVAEADLADRPRVLLLVVGRAARGLGLGRKLLDEAARHVASEGSGRYWLATDTFCDWPFYEHLGLSRLAERSGTVPGAPERYFLYGI